MHFRALSLLLFTALACGCRGGISDKPPIHPVLDMDFQAKLKAQSESKFEGWRDGNGIARGMRLPVAGTVARPSAAETALLAQYPGLHTFKNADGTYVTANALPKTEAILERGRERFDIVCATCHGRTGGGGLVARRWPALGFKEFDGKQYEPFNISQRPDLAAQPDGQIFETISAGRNTMPGYAHQIDAFDRWAIVHYLRALQLHMKN